MHHLDLDGRRSNTDKVAQQVLSLTLRMIGLSSVQPCTSQCTLQQHKARVSLKYHHLVKSHLQSHSVTSLLRNQTSNQLLNKSQR